MENLHLINSISHPFTFEDESLTRITRIPPNLFPDRIPQASSSSSFASGFYSDCLRNYVFVTASHVLVTMNTNFHQVSYHFFLPFLLEVIFFFLLVPLFLFMILLKKFFMNCFQLMLRWLLGNIDLTINILRLQHQRKRFHIQQNKESLRVVLKLMTLLPFAGVQAGHG